MRTAARRTLILAFLILALAAPPAQAAFSPERLFAGLWGRLAALWAETGCTFDPNGSCRDQTAPAGPGHRGPSAITANTGLTFDPDGRTAPPSSDTGLIVDPNGRPAPISRPDSQ